MIGPGVRLASALALLGLLTGTPGCTIRYSQSLVGEIQALKPAAIRNSDSGTGVGIGGPFAPPATIAFSEPMSADELLQVPCEIALAQVDYRAKYYAYYIGVDFPEVQVVSYCVPPP